MHVKRKPIKNYTAYYPLLMEPELKMRLAELKTFYHVDVPEEIRQLIREWVKRVEESLK